jgi:hypothetical protein
MYPIYALVSLIVLTWCVTIWASFAEDKPRISDRLF